MKLLPLPCFAISWSSMKALIREILDGIEKEPETGGSHSGYSLWMKDVYSLQMI